MSDTDKSSGSLDWAIVDNQGDIPDDDVTSTASSVEVMDEDEEEESFGSHGTPVAGSPNTNMPKFVLRLPSQSTHIPNVSDTDDEPSDNSTYNLHADASIASVPESLPSSDVPSASSSAHGVAGQTYRQSSSSARISRDDIDDLCNKIDDLKKALEPTKDVDNVSPADMFGAGRPDVSPSPRQVSDFPRPVENLQPNECFDGETSLLSSISSSYSFLSRDAATDARTDPGLPEDTEGEQLLVEKLLADQNPATPTETAEEAVEGEVEVQEPGNVPENTIDLLQVEQGQNYLQTVVSYFVDYRDIISWMIGFGSYTGVVVAMVMFLSVPAPAPTCQPAVPPESVSNDFRPVSTYCHDDDCSPKISEYRRKEAAASAIIEELKNMINDNNEYIDELTERKNQLDEKIIGLKRKIEILDKEVQEMVIEKARLRDKKAVAYDGWKKEWQDGLTQLAKLRREKEDLKNELHNMKIDSQSVREDFAECKYQRDTEGKERVQNADIVKQARNDLDSVRVQCQNDIDEIKSQCQNDIDKIKVHCKNDLGSCHNRWEADLKHARDQSRLDLDEAKSRCQTYEDSMKVSHQYEIEELRKQHIDQLEDAIKSCQRKVDDDADSTRSDKWYYDDSGNDDDDHGYSSEFPKDIPDNHWANTVIKLMNSTRSQIENTWAQVKNMSETLWNDHEPTISSLQQTLKKEFSRLKKFQQKVSHKLKKWFGRKHKKAAKTRRRKYETDDAGSREAGLHPTVEERLVELSYRVDHFSAKTFRKAFKRKPAVLESIQAEFKDIDATKKISSTYEEKIKWKDYILTDQHLKWLRCQQKFWEDFNKAPEDCFAELCCWEVKIVDGDVKACKRFKRRHGMVEDQCYLELPKEVSDMDDDDEEIPDATKYVADKQDSDSEDNDNWFLEMGEERDYHRTEPDDWFFRRKNKDQAQKPSHETLDSDDIEDLDDDDDDFVYVDEVNNCYPDRCDYP